MARRTIRTFEEALLQVMAGELVLQASVSVRAALLNQEPASGKTMRGRGDDGCSIFIEAAMLFFFFFAGQLKIDRRSTLGV